MIPASRAASIISKLVASSVNSPKFMVPRANRLTLSPVRPKFTYFIFFPPLIMF
ncbi:hypothetical protein [Methanobrevibacter arboriphilus]|uniref:hypothetical protein n=1 Tax=Methanobrevibacter arboriphilus TaxID=39441 RepID=UPI001E365349|nr:hypothetical protein [Methanobrevibacter arboriphilus]